jgi:hypothetical protein
MKNIHILLTDKPSRLYQLKNDILRLDRIFSKGTACKNIYITSDEEIKEGVDQWYLDKVLNEPYNSGGAQYSSKQDVIILTTDQDLIADGVQAIDDEFLEWFVKNPSCESIGVEKLVFRYSRVGVGYKIIIPKEEPKNICIQTGLPCGMQCLSEEACNRTKSKQETLEEVAEKATNIPNLSWENEYAYNKFLEGAKWQQERTIEEVFDWLTTNNYLTDLKETLIENFKTRLQG